MAAPASRRTLLLLHGLVHLPALASGSSPPCPAWVALRQCSVQVDPLASPQELFAATELRRWLGNVTGSPWQGAEFGAPVLINAGAAKPNMMYVKSGAQAPDDPRAIITEEKGNGAGRTNLYETSNGGLSWHSASQHVSTTLPLIKTALVPAAGGWHDLAYWLQMAETSGLNRPLHVVNATGVQYLRHNASGWFMSRHEAQRVTFDLGEHTVWRAKAAGTTIEEGPFLLDQMDASVVCGLPDKSCLVLVTVQWGGNPASWAIPSTSVVAFRAVAPFVNWTLRGVVGNASKFQGSQDGYSEGPNENAVVLLPDNHTLMAVWRNEAQGPPATTVATECQECSYTRALSTDLGASWGAHKFLPPGVGAVTPTMLMMRDGAGRAGPLLLSGGRQNTSHITGNLTSHNFDNVLWISWDGWGDRWEPHSLSYWHNHNLPASAPSNHRFTATTNDTWQSNCPARESSAATSLFQTSPNSCVVMYPQITPAEPLEPKKGCPLQPADMAAHGWSMRVTLSGMSPPPGPGAAPAGQQQQQQLGGCTIAVGVAAALQAGLAPADLSSLEPDEGFIAASSMTESSGPPAYILTGASNSSRGTLYAVYNMLGQLGLRFFGVDAVQSPRSCPAALPRFNVTGRPVIKHRRVESWDTVANPEHALRLHLNGPTDAAPGKVFGPIPVSGKYSSPPGFVHTSYRLLLPSGVAGPGGGPPPNLFRDHPEWFWPRGSAPTMGQLCWGNQSLVQLIVTNVRHFLRGDPSAQIISVSQNDNQLYCRSPAELAIMAEEGGSPMAPLLRAVNQIADEIADEFPAVVVDTLAYEWSRHPVPTRTRPRANVAIRLCSIEADFGHSMTHPSNAAFAADLRAWHSLTRAAHLHVWTYTVNFGAYVQPFPNSPSIIGENIHFFAAQGVSGVYMEGAPPTAGRIWSDLEELKNFVMAEMLWDPTASPTALASDFLRFYYGAAAAPHITEYMAAVAAGVAATNATAQTIPHPWNPCNVSHLPYLTPEVLLRGVAAFAKADVAAAEPVLAARVARASLAPLLPVLWRWDELRKYSVEHTLPWPFAATSSLRDVFQNFSAIYAQNKLGDFNVYEGVNGAALDQSPLDWLKQELFAPAIPALGGYNHSVGFIGATSKGGGGSVLCPNKTCATMGAALCDRLGVGCAGFAFFEPATCKPVCAVQWYAGSIEAVPSWCDPPTCKQTGGARWNLYRKTDAQIALKVDDKAVLSEADTVAGAVGRVPLVLTALESRPNLRTKSDDEQLSQQTQEWWRWVVVRVSNFASWIQVDDEAAREEFLALWQPDLFDWAGDGRWNVREWARLRGRAVAQAGALEFEEALFCHTFNQSLPNIVNDTFGPSNGMAVDLSGKLPGLTRGAPFMTHAAPKWALAVGQADARAALIGDAVTQDNSVGDISMAGWDYGFGPWEEARYRSVYDLNATFSIRAHVSGVMKRLKAEELITEEYVQKYLLFSYKLWRDAWRDVANVSKAAALSVGKAVPAIYGNVGVSWPMSIIESPHHDAFWIESFDWEGFPPQRPSDPPKVVSTLVMRLAEAAVRGLHKPVWRCAQQCRMQATQRLYLSEAVACGGNSWHLNGFMHSRTTPPSESAEGTWALPNQTSFGYTEHLRSVNFTNQFRFLFTDRTRLADVAVVYSLSSVFWRHAGVLSAGTNHSHEVHLTAACRLLEDTHKQYEIVALGHKGLWENELGIERLRKAPSEGGYKLVILPNVDAMSDADLALISRYVQSGGRLVVTGTSGAFATASRDENLRLRGPGALDKLLKLSGKVHHFKTFAQYLSCTHATCAKARDAAAEEIDSIDTDTGTVLFGAQLPPNVWQNVFVHGAGPMVAVHLVNYNVSGTVGTLACRTCKLTNVPLEQPVHVSVSMKSTGLPAKVNAMLYQPGAPVQKLGITTRGGLHSVTFPRMDTYCVVVLATEDELTARGTAALARTWLERALIASRSSGLPTGAKLDKSAMLSADKLLGRLQGDSAVRAANRSADFFSVANLALMQEVPLMQAMLDDVQKLVSSAEDTELAAVSGMCAGHDNCLAAFSFQQTARLSYTPLAKSVAGFTTVAGAPIYEASSGFGFTHPPAASIRDAKNPSLLSFDTLLPDDLHRGGIFGNESSTFQVDLTFESPLPKELILSIVSGWHDLGAPNRSMHFGGGDSDFGAWMGFASTSVSTVWSTARTTQPRPCLLGVRGRNPGYFHTRACRVSLAGVQPGNVSLSIVLAIDGGTWDVGNGGTWFPFAWLVNALAVQQPDAPRPDPVLHALADSDAQAASGVHEFAWVGPFEAADGQGLSTVYPPEAIMMRTKHAPELTARYTGKHGQSVTWQAYRAPAGAAPYVPLGRLLGARGGRNSTVGSVAFLMAEITLNATQRVRLSSGMSGLGKVWVVAGGDVKPVLEDRFITGLMAAENERVITLTPGLNTIIIKSVHTFAADFADVNGRWGPVGGPIQKDSEWGAALGLHLLDSEQLALKSDDTNWPTLLQPLTEASGVACGDAIAAGSFCNGNCLVAVSSKTDDNVADVHATLKPPRTVTLTLLNHYDNGNPNDNPLAGLPALPKVHYSWPFPSGDEGPTGPILLDYARITHALPIDVNHNALEFFTEANVRERILIAAKTNASLSLNWSPYITFCQPECRDPRHDGPKESREIAYFRSRLSNLTVWLAAANAARSAETARVRVGAVLVDQEAGWNACVNGSRPGPNDPTVQAIITKNNLIYDTSKEFFPDAHVEQYGRGAIARCSGLGDWSFDPVHANACWCSTVAGAWRGLAPPPGEASCGGYTLLEKGDSFNPQFYNMGDEYGYGREAFNRTANSAIAHGVKWVNPWIWLGGGAKRIVQNWAGRIDENHWNYETINDWMLGAEINNPYYGDHPERFALWHMAKHAMFYPSIFDTRAVVQTPCGKCSMALQHFVAYVNGANNVTRLGGPAAKSPPTRACDCLTKEFGLLNQDFGA